MPYPTIPYHTLPYPTLIKHTLPYLPYHTLPYLTIPYPTIPYHTIPQGATALESFTYKDKSCEFNKEWLSDQGSDYKCITQEDYGWVGGHACHQGHTCA